MRYEIYIYRNGQREFLKDVGFLTEAMKDVKSLRKHYTVEMFDTKDDVLHTFERRP